MAKPQHSRAKARVPFRSTALHASGTKLCVLALAIGMAGSAHAQQSEAVEEITITGSRIQRVSGMETPTPVTVVSLTNLADMNPRQLVESLSQLPQFLNNQRPQNTGGLTTGGSNLNLRGAGSSRTLVLLNGRRMPSGNRYGVVNVSALPQAAISNVEIVTGGASAAYGTDAVAGVVNFVLNTEFEGFTANVQAGTTTRRDGDNYGASATYGTAIGDRGHLLLSADWYDQEIIHSLDALKSRPWFQQRAWVTNPTPGGPTFITRNFVRQTNMATGGIINQPGSALDKLEFVRSGGQIVTQPLNFSGVGIRNGGCNCFAENERDKSWGMDADNAVQQANYRHSLFGYYDFDVNENLTLFAQGIYGFAGVRGPWFNSVVLTGPWQATIFAENPFLPPNVRTTMAAEGRDRFNMGYSGLAPLDRASPLGSYNVEQNDEVYSGTVGFDYNFSEGFLEGWNLNTYAQYSESGQEMIFRGGMIMGRLPLALDVVSHPTTGSPVCRAALVNPGTFGDCVPVNLFGGVESVSPRAASYLLDEKAVVASDSEQTVAEAVLNGEVHEGIGAGPVMMAVGASYRKDELRQWKHDLRDEFVYLNGVNTGFRGLVPENVVVGGMRGVRAGSVPPGFTGNANLSNVLFTGSYQTPSTVLTGGFAVKEAFGELEVPLLADRPLVENLDLNMAYRYAEYTGSGGIDSWKYGLSWRLTEEFRVRATRSRDVRAANIRERFDATAGGANVNDPVFNNAVIGTASRTGGNPLVEPEKADTVTVGFVWQPGGALEGLGLSFDWFDIDVKDALGQLTFQNIVTGCFNGAVDLCQYVHRDPTTRQITRIDSLFINLSRQVLTGIDIELNYQRDIDLFGGGESLGFRIYASQVKENYNQLPRAARDNIGLEQPEWRLLPALTYSRGPFRVFLQGRYFDSRTLNRLWREGVNIDDNSVPSVTYADLNLSYEMELGEQTYRLFANATNLFDRAPPQTPGNPGFVGGTGGPSAALYDTVGRTYTIGANVSF